MDPRELALYLAGALDGLAEAVTVIGPDWRYRYLSPRAAELIGRPNGELVGALVWDVFPEVVGTPEHEVALRAMRERTPERIIWLFPGTGRWYEQRQVPAGDGLLVLVDDITEQERASHRAERLVEIGEALAVSTTPEQVNDVVVRQVLPQVDAPDGSIVLVDEEREVLRTLGWTGPGREAWEEYPMTARTPGTAAYRTGLPYFASTLADIGRDYPDIVPALAAADRRSIAVLPLPVDGRVLGLLATSWHQERVLTAGERQFLSTAAAMAAQALERASLLDAERRSVRALQRSLLPQALPVVPGIDAAVRYVASDRAAQVGGDWYDVVPLPGGAVGIVIGDVEGHDLEAAALMGLMRSAVRAYALDGHPPAVLLARVNAFLSGLQLGRIVTMAYSQLHPRELLVTTVSAGHPPTLVASPGGVVIDLPSEIGPPLGVHESGVHWVETTSTLPEHGMLAMFTDGLVEVRGEDLDRGLDRLRSVLAVSGGRTADDIADVLLAARVARHDDVALLVARLTAPAEEGRRVGRRLPAAPASAPLARRFTRQLLQAWEVPAAVVEGAELIVTELVTNAARHSEDDLELGLSLTPVAVRVEVSDTSHRMPVPPRETPDDSTSGRGLLLVETLASRWGVESEGLAKQVWAELDL